MASADEMIGSQLGSFRLVRLLGTGGMGSVFLGRHAVIGSQVAIKVLHPKLTCDPLMLQRFEDEARAVNLIGHGNILRIFDFCREGDVHFLVMEYLEGQSLSQVPMPMEPEQAIPVLAQLCEGLAAAHERGVVHRDVKAQNVILVERDGEPPLVKLLDFGGAKLLHDAGERTVPGFIIGTPTYMAPEQFRGTPLDGRADLYAVGVLSYLMITGQLPFQEEQTAALMHAHLHVSPPPTASLRPGANERWSEITLRAMAKRPEERHPDALALRDDLLAVLGNQPPRPSRATPMGEPRHARPPIKVDVVGEDGAVQRTVTGTELSMDGVFLAAPGFAPPLFSRLGLTLHTPGGGALPLKAEVARLVSPEKAATRRRPGAPTSGCRT